MRMAKTPKYRDGSVWRRLHQDDATLCGIYDVGHAFWSHIISCHVMEQTHQMKTDGVDVFGRSSFIILKRNTNFWVSHSHFTWELTILEYRYIAYCTITLPYDARESERDTVRWMSLCRCSAIIYIYMGWSAILVPAEWPRIRRVRVHLFTWWSNGIAQCFHINHGCVVLCHNRSSKRGVWCLHYPRL